ncbi:hypothetical protein Taro_038072 [Colocasia esculenta]|uniref:Uncharacterized protein n=1 Tax=Colocasia esculenta TaxID=4460 RepID=A0A843W2D6_COLES|nr:hypothetical protein [Colocasia esculenta]
MTTRSLLYSTRSSIRIHVHSTISSLSSIHVHSTISSLSRLVELLWLLSARRVSEGLQSSPGGREPPENTCRGY